MQNHALKPAIQAFNHDSGFARYSIPVLLSPRHVRRFSRKSLRKSVKAIHQCSKVAFRIGSYAQFDACEGLVRAYSSQ